MGSIFSTMRDRVQKFLTLISVISLIKRSIIYHLLKLQDLVQDFHCCVYVLAQVHNLIQEPIHTAVN